MGEQILNEAKKLLKQGCSVIPIKNGGKKPAVAWDEYQKRIATENEVDSWFNNTDNHQLGLVTGNVSGGRCIIDFDGEGWAELFETFLQEFPEFLDTLIVETGSGKSHLHFVCPEMPPSLSKKVRVFSNGQMELRANGHQTLVPPSLHPSGNRYKYMDESKAPITISAERLNQILNWLTPIVMKSSPSDEKKPNGWRENIILNGVKEGERNNAMTSLAGSYLSYGLSRVDILPILKEANAKCEPPLGEKEVENILDSMIKTDEKNHPKKEQGEVYEILEPPKPLDLTFPIDVIRGPAHKFATLYCKELESSYAIFAINYLTCLGNLICDKIELDSSLKTEARLSLVNIGESAFARKSEGKDQTLDFFRSFMEYVMGTWVSPPEQLSFFVREGVNSAEGLAKIFGELAP